VPATPERPQLACVELLDHGELPRDLGEIWHRGQTHGRLELTLLRSWTRHVRPSPPRRAGETLLTGAASGPRQAEIPGTEIADVLKATDTSANVGGRLLQARSQIVQALHRCPLQRNRQPERCAAGGVAHPRNRHAAD